MASPEPLFRSELGRGVLHESRGDSHPDCCLKKGEDMAVEAVALPTETGYLRRRASSPC